MNWDPGEYDGHLPWFLDTYNLRGGRALDPGCGNGKSAVWLAERGFEVVGIDLSTSAIEQARRRAALHGVSDRASFYEGRFPDGLPERNAADGAADRTAGGASDGRASRRRKGRALLAPNSFDLVTERAFLQHLGHGRQLRTTVELLAATLKPGALLYSLMIAAEGSSGHWGIVKWSQSDIRSALGQQFEIVAMRRDVFTPGEPGSVPAWITVARGREIQ